MLSNGSSNPEASASKNGFLLADASVSMRNVLIKAYLAAVGPAPTEAAPGRYRRTCPLPLSILSTSAALRRTWKEWWRFRVSLVAVSLRSRRGKPDGGDIGLHRVPTRLSILPILRQKRGGSPFHSRIRLQDQNSEWIWPERPAQRRDLQIRGRQRRGSESHPAKCDCGSFHDY